jgi:hypothetical protein
VRLASTDVLLRRDGPLRLSRAGGQVTAIVPEARQHGRLKRACAARRGLRRQPGRCFTFDHSPGCLAVGPEHRVRQITFELDQGRREHSARRVLTGLAGLCFLLSSMPLHRRVRIWPFRFHCAAYRSDDVLLGWHLPEAVCAGDGGFRRNPEPGTDGRDNANAGLHTADSRLRDEAEMAPALVARIDALRWPKSLLDVKYICEAGDEATIAALEAQNLGPECEIVRVPAFGPRTKPKALQYALQGARGSLIAVYDAEDKPAPGQLLEAWAAFRRATTVWAVCRHRLAVANLSSNWISGLFALEYSGLFRVLIPFLAHTRNADPAWRHVKSFPPHALEKVGGWDPHNVTEDADLGLRLYAHGYRTGISTMQPWRVAPVQLERLDTAANHAGSRAGRKPGWWPCAGRCNDQASLGQAGFAVFPAVDRRHARLCAGAPADVRLHRLDAGMGGKRHGFSGLGPARHPYVDRPINIAGSYLVFAAMGWFGFTGYERTRLKRRWVLLTPLYWLLMSVAGWRALGQLASNAHLWEKTPHPAAPEWAAVAEATNNLAKNPGMERVKGIEPSS